MPFDPYAESVAQALTAAPSLVHYPSMVLAAANDPQPSLAATSMAVALQQNALAQATQNSIAAQAQAQAVQGTQNQHTGGVFGDFMHLLNAPAREVSHLYRYMREAFHTQGVMGGMTVLMGTAAGAALGTVALPGFGTALGAEFGAELTRGIGGNGKAYDASSDGEHFTIDGKKVSIGRDLVGITPGLDGDTDRGFSKLLSGAADATFDVTSDPMNIVGKISAIRRSSEGFASLPIVGPRIAAKDGFLARFAPGMQSGTPERVDMAEKAYSGVRRAWSRIAQLDAGGVVHEFPELAPVAKELGAAHTYEDVKEVFRGAAVDENLRDRIVGKNLPSLALFRPLTNKMRDAIKMADTSLADPKNITGRVTELPFLLGAKQGTISADGTVNRSYGLRLGAVFHPTALPGAFSRKWRTITGQQPFNINSLHEITGEFKADDPNALQGVYQTMRFSMGVKTAQRWTTTFANADTVAEKHGIWANAMEEMLKTAGIGADVDTFNKVTGRARAYAVGDQTPRYLASRETGDLASQVMDENDNLIDRMAGYQFQEGKLAFPNFKEVHNVLRDLNGFGNMYGNVDDALAAAYTDKIFKPLAVMSAGFGIRDALSETLPGMFQHGTFRMLKAMVVAQAAKNKYLLDEGVNESHHVLAVVSKLLGGAQALARTDPSTREFFTRLVVSNKGHIVTGGAAAGHQVTAFGTPDPVGQMEDALQDMARHNIGSKGKDAMHPMMTGNGEFRMWGPTDGIYNDHWVSGLQKRALEPSVRHIARDLQEAHGTGFDLDNEAVIDKLIELERQRIVGRTYKGEDQTLRRYREQDPSEFAAARVGDVRNYVMGRDGTVHTNLIDKLAAGEKPTHGDIEGIPVESMPDRIVGEDMHPVVPANVYDRFLQVGFHKLVEPWSSFLSRQPIYGLEAKKHFDGLKKFVDQGIFTDEQAFMLAKQRAAVSIIPQVQIAAVKSQFSMITKNFMPFFYAQEQAIKRAATLIKKDPSVLAKYAWTNYAMVNPAWIHTDDNGNRFMVVPGMGEFGKMLGGAISHFGMPVVGGLPLTYNGTVESFKNAMPYSPLMNDASGFGIGPVVSLPMNWLANMDPSFAPIVKSSLGDMGYATSWYNALIPSTPLRSILTGLTADERDKTFANAQMSAYQAAYYHDQFPKNHADGTAPSAWDLQVFNDKIKNSARNAFFAKAFLGFLSPVGASPVLQDVGPDGKTFSAEFQDMMKKNGNIADALLEWQGLHGERSIAYTVPHSKSDYGVTIPGRSKPALEWIQGNKDLIHKYGSAAALFIPQINDTSGDGNLIHNELLVQGMKHMDTPQEFQEAIYTSVGNSQYFAKRKERDDLLKQYTDKNSRAAITANWTAWSDQFKVLNPIWANTFFSQTRQNDAKETLARLDAMQRNGDLPVDQPQAQLVIGLLNQFYQQKAAIAQLGNASVHSVARGQIRDNWVAYLDQVKQTQPLLADAVHSIFVPLEKL